MGCCSPARVGQELCTPSTIWRTTWGSWSVCGRAFTPKSEGSCLVADGLSEQLLQPLHILDERRAAGVGHAVEGLRLALHKLLFYRNVAGFFKLGELRAQVAVCRPGPGAQPGKLRFLNSGKQREQSQAQFPVDHRIQLRQLRHDWPPSCVHWLRGSSSKRQKRSGRGRWRPERQSSFGGLCQYR